ncbi:MAG: chemotaxis protein CheX [Rhodoferax sp.]|nr:chemotaxis protein CheX [Rhodoferax sp.]
MDNELVSKVLVLENDPSHSQAIRQFCKEHCLVALTVDKNHLLAVMRSNIDLGAILIAENFAGDPEESLAIARALHMARPELPIILRRDTVATLDDLPEAFQPIFSTAFVADDMEVLGRAIDESLFSMVYPNALLRGIAEITLPALESHFRGYSVTVDTPYIVRDRLTFGEIFSFIPLESTWCRGYMMLQTEEDPLLVVLNQKNENQEKTHFRTANNLIGEITNLIWGAFKNRFIGDAAADSGSTIQVPIVMNQKHGYVSFGAENPELCYRYTLTSENPALTVVIYQRFSFNLQWSPEKFKEIEQEVAESIDTGELEMF